MLPGSALPLLPRFFVKEGIIGTIKEETLDDELPNEVVGAGVRGSGPEEEEEAVSVAPLLLLPLLSFGTRELAKSPARSSADVGRVGVIPDRSCCSMVRRVSLGDGPVGGGCGLGKLCTGMIRNAKGRHTGEDVGSPCWYDDIFGTAPGRRRGLRSTAGCCRYCRVLRYTTQK